MRMTSQHARRDIHLADQLRLERLDDRAVGSDDLADDLRLVQLAAVGQRRVGVDQLDRRHDVVALPDARPGRSRPGRSAAPRACLLPLVRRDDARTPRRGDRSRSVRRTRTGSPSSRVDRCPSMPATWKKIRVAGVAEAAVDVARSPKPRSVPVVEPGGPECQDSPSWQIWVVAVIFLSARPPVPVTSL